MGKGFHGEGLKITGFFPCVEMKCGDDLGKKNVESVQMTEVDDREDALKMYYLNSLCGEKIFY